MSVTEKIANNKLVKKVVNSKVVSKALDASDAVGASVCLLATNAFAAEGSTDLSSVITAAANIDSIMENAKPFVSPAIIIMCSIAGLRMGMKFLRGAAK